MQRFDDLLHLITRHRRTFVGRTSSSSSSTSGTCPCRFWLPGFSLAHQFTGTAKISRIVECCILFSASTVRNCTGDERTAQSMPVYSIVLVYYYILYSDADNSTTTTFFVHSSCVLPRGGYNSIYYICTIYAQQQCGKTVRCSSFY